MDVQRHAIAISFFDISHDKEKPVELKSTLKLEIKQPSFPIDDHNVALLRVVGVLLDAVDFLQAIRQQ